MRFGTDESGNWSIGPRAIAIGAGLFVAGFVVFVGAVDVATEAFHLTLPFSPLAAGPLAVTTPVPVAITTPVPVAVTTPVPLATPSAAPKAASPLASAAATVPQKRSRRGAERRPAAAQQAGASPCPKPAKPPAVPPALPAHRTAAAVPTALNLPAPRSVATIARHATKAHASAARPRARRTPVPLLVSRSVSGLLVPVSPSTLIHANADLDPRAAARQPLFIEPGSGATPSTHGTRPKKR